MKRRFCLLAALPLVLGACAGEDAAEMETTDVPAADMPAATPPGDAGMEAMATTVAMTPLGDSGVNGEAILTPAGDQTEVSVTLNGLEPTATHPGHIHDGSCEAVGSVVVPLSPITADASGSGTMTMTPSIPADSVMGGNYIVVYHNAGGTPAVCGEITGQMM